MYRCSEDIRSWFSAGTGPEQPRVPRPELWYLAGRPEDEIRAAEILWLEKRVRTSSTLTSVGIGEDRRLRSALGLSAGVWCRRPGGSGDDCDFPGVEGPGAPNCAMSPDSHVAGGNGVARGFAIAGAVVASSLPPSSAKRSGVDAVAHRRALARTVVQQVAEVVMAAAFEQPSQAAR
jgi:hypothetical protein